MNLGSTLYSQGKMQEAIAEFREVTRINPDHAEAFYSLGVVLGDLEKLDEAMVAYRKAIQIKHDYLEAHGNLGGILRKQGKLDEAIAEYRLAVESQPDSALARYKLGHALSDKAKWVEAAVEYRAAIRHEPKYAEAHCNLGLALLKLGHPVEALDELHRGHELGIKQPGWNSPSARWVRDCELRIALEPRLSAFLKGGAKPKNAAEALDLATVSDGMEMRAAAARFKAEAFAIDPKLADDRQNWARYNAACAAVVASCGRSKDDPPPDEVAKTKLRRQALEWLKEELSAWSKHLESDKAEDRATVQKVMQHWRNDADLAPFRDPDARARLTEAEWKEWQELWSKVEALLKRARPAVSVSGQPKPSA